jgi:hypothetical protein
VLKLLPYRSIQWRSNHRLMALIILHDLIIGQAHEQLHPPVNAGAHHELGRIQVRASGRDIPSSDMILTNA